ncbi:hypothetical protein [Methylobacterium durans]|uniref:Uncharacterized protein n=1 Tax=Methylobacterium durans TaxID=2202825 RepID=A0A2U8WC66_9HYPH|nr:hypothetical protein [Methylobacterium durans]AWN43201.1 hypothetical protein DK389_25240 [Methylobacterium durans]
MTDREESQRLLMEFIDGGDASQAAAAAGTIVAFVAKIDGPAAQIAALNELRLALANQCKTRDLSGEAEDRHVIIEDAIEKAMNGLQGKPA